MADSIITDTATKIFQDLCEADTVNKAEKGEWPAALWDALEESGMPLMWVPDEFGGAGAELADGFAVLRVAGRFAAPVPLAETLLAGWLLAEAKIAAPSGPMTIAPVYEDGHIIVGADGKLRGRARHVPFARSARHIAVAATRNGEPVVALVAAEGLAISPGVGLSGEPRDTVSFDGAAAIAVEPAPGLDLAKLTLFAAAARTQQMAGALERILDQSVTYAMDRVQFGRPIAKFQAVQHNLAALAGEVAAASAAADGAAEAITANGVASD
ncbi:MAG TPA: acyl-CoA dehydrogenase family protein, partial [Stellaceae bacterium]|nr:acyl-CoA dehydrogenase family protein [Stellaceae bacterium]